MENEADAAYYTEQDENALKRQAQRQSIFEAIYRFFYKIWPGINNFLKFVFYHIIRIIKGSIKTALEQLKQG